jgi:hypothetical protein
MKRILLIAALVCVGFTKINSAVAVIAPTAKIEGKSYAEWSAAWWQWALSLPANDNPFFDEGVSVNGANGQSGKVWFLTGVINESGTAARTLTVPKGTMLFFPVINTEASTLEVGTPFYGSNETELRETALSFALANAFAQIDGVPVQNLDRYTFLSPLFSFSVPDDNVLGVPSGEGFSVSNGVYLMLAPLPVGQHVIHFGGTFADFAFSLDITYVIDVSAR